MGLWVKIIFLGLGTGLILWYSRTSLINWRSHGFYRFFAWELILILICVNIDFWIKDPLAIHQLIAWFLLIISLVWIIWGVRMMRKIGKPDETRTDDPTLLGIEKTSQLVTVGIFKYIRNPLYSSLLFLNWGAFFKHPSWIGLCLAIPASLFLFITAKIEERENINFFGEPYREYMKKSKMFIPYLW